MKDTLNIYTSLDEARVEIQRRWNDEELKKKVAEYLGKMPEPLCDEPRAVLFRNITTPDHELLHFLDLAREINLKPLGLEFVEDRFCTINADKVCLCRMAFFEKRNKKGDVVMHYERLTDLTKSNNKKFTEIETFGGEKLVDFHHRLLERSIGKTIETYDMSQWLIANGIRAREYYKRMLALFICHSVLFESFVTDDVEAVFEKNIVLPAIEEIQRVLGVRPLIVQLLPDVEDRYWWCYPDTVGQAIDFKP